MAISNKTDADFDTCEPTQFYRHFLKRSDNLHRVTIPNLFNKTHRFSDEFIFNVKLVQSELLRALYA